MIDDVRSRLNTALSGRYSIVRELGRGGMATVYLADDVRHDRQVAIKVMLPDLAAALGSERFLREIKLTASLNHPHILPVHDSGAAAGFLYYVMPYVDGESLRDRIDREKQLPIDDSLRITREVADALASAHARGVVHRDIKPENILLDQGHALVADFGIARAITEAGGEKLTQTGLAIGTPAYMSLEQATGEDVDERSDVYSLACVLYEMLGGEPPYTGATASAILARKSLEPIPRVSVVRETVPLGIDGALAKALAKAPADRFDTAKQFAEALARPEDWALPDSGERKPKRRRGLPLIATAVGALAIIALLVGLPLFDADPLTITTSDVRQVTRDPGPEHDPAISPDGNEVAYFADGVYVRALADIAGGDAIRLGGDLPGWQTAPLWSRDGQLLRFWSCPLSERRNAWNPDNCDPLEIAKFGGTPRTLERRVGTFQWVWSPEEDRIAFTLADSIVVGWFSDGRTDVLAAIPAAPDQGRTAAHSFAWSPNGETIAFVVGNWPWRTPSLNISPSSIWVVSASGGDPVRITSDAHLDQSPAWLPDNRHLLFVSNRRGSREVYAVEVGLDGPRGPPVPLPGGSNAHSLSVSEDGRRLAYSKFESRTNIWAYPISASGPASVVERQAVTSGNQVVELHGLSPGGDSIAFDSDINGNQDIFKTPTWGGGLVTLTTDPGDDFGPAWSPDGTEIAFYSTRSGNRDIWLMRADGTDKRQLTDDPSWDSHPSWSPDGNTIVFQSMRSGGIHLWRVTRDQDGDAWSEPERFTDLRCWYPAEWAPDGSALVCEQSNTWALVSSAGEPLLNPDPRELGFSRMVNPHLSPDGATVYFVAIEEDGSRAVWAMPLAGGDPRLAVTLDHPAFAGVYDMSVGAANIYLSIQETESDVWVMDLEW